MDSILWHSICTTNPASRPDPSEMEKLDVSQENLAIVRYSDHVAHYLQNANIPSPIHDEVISELGESIKFVLGQPRGARTIVAVTGPFSVGKSSLVKRWAQDEYRRLVGPMTRALPTWRPPNNTGLSADHVPILYLNLQGDTRSKDLYFQILAFLRHPTTGSKVHLANQVFHAFQLHGVQTLILDDAHMLRTQLVQGRETLDAIKAIATALGELGGQLVLVGAWDTQKDLLEDPQIRSRLRIHDCQPYCLSTQEDCIRWQRYLLAWEREIQSVLPETSVGTIHAGEAPELIFERTQGYVGNVSSCLADATKRAIRARKTFLSLDDIPTGLVSQQALDSIAVRGSRRKSSSMTKRQGRAV